jgi:hypothetical protein
VSGAPTTSTQNTLRKLGAHLRWFIEKSGVNPEGVYVAIVVNSKADHDRITAAFAQEHDRQFMVRFETPDRIAINGVKVTVTVAK